MNISDGWRRRLAGSRVTLKQHRFEVGVAALAAIAVGLMASAVVYRLDAIDVPPGCINDWLTLGPEGRPHCAGPMRSWVPIVAVEAQAVLSSMSFLPFVVGLLGGVPIIARELESGTAQTAWSLNGSRLKWLLRVAVPVVVVLSVAIAFSAAGASAVEERRVAWGLSPAQSIGSHGPVVVVRAFGAFGLGLVAGAAIGRSLPGFVVGAILTAVVLFGVGVANERWLAIQEPVVIDASTDITTGWAWLTPDGATIADVDAMGVVPTAVSELDSQQVQPVHSMEWLEDHGYELIAMGVTEEVALGWTAYDALAFGLVGSISIAAAIVVVNRRRPAQP